MLSATSHAARAHMKEEGFDKDLRSAATAQTGHMTPSLLIAAFVGSALAAVLILVATRPVVRLQALQQAYEGE